MSETSRVQRWREGKRQHGLKAITIWLTAAAELRLKDLVLQWHCSPSAVMQRALDQVATNPPQHGSPPDTTQIHELIRAELDARQAEQALVTETVTEAVTATVTATVTETTTATLARDLPAMVRQLVEGLALEALGLPVTDMFGDVTDTEDDITDTNGDVTDTEMLGVSATDTNGNPTDTAPTERSGKHGAGSTHSPASRFPLLASCFPRWRGPNTHGSPAAPRRDAPADSDAATGAS